MPKDSRFVIRFVNGAWVAFDRHTFRHMERFPRLADAEAAFRRYGYL